MEKNCIFGMEVIINRKKIKNLYIRVREGKIIVSAPRRMPENEVYELVASREEWIKAAASNNNKGTLGYSDGSEVFVFGKPYILRLDRDRIGGYRFEGNNLVLGVGKTNDELHIKKALSTVYRMVLEQILPDLTEKCQKECGLYANEWRIRDMKTRWGSCNVKEKRIWLSLWLAEKPPECIEATVFHELVHLKVRGHGKDFYDLLLKICPDYYRIHRSMKQK